MMFYGYVDRTTDTGSPFYVGKGTSYRLRRVRRNKKHGHVVSKHGLARTVEYVSENESAVLEWERYTIGKLGTFSSRLFGIGCNFTEGGDGVSGKRSPEAISRIASANRTDKRRAQVGEWRRNKPVSEETRKKQSASHTGKALSLEHIEALKIHNHWATSNQEVRDRHASAIKSALANRSLSDTRPSMATQLRQTGATWSEVARELGYKTASGALMAAKRFQT